MQEQYPQSKIYRRTFRYDSVGDGNIEHLSKQWGTQVEEILLVRDYILQRVIGNCVIYEGPHNPKIIAVMRADIGDVSDHPYRFPPDLEIVIVFSGTAAINHFVDHDLHHWHVFSSHFDTLVLGPGPTEIAIVI